MKSLIVRSLWVLAFAMLATPLAQAQVYNKPGGGYAFTVEMEHGKTSVKDQASSSTCWSFSTLSFLESELLRMGKGEYNLSEMFIVRNTYLEKAKRYVRMNGNLNFAGGGAFHDVTSVLASQGLVPESAYPGLEYGTSRHAHGELDAVTKAVCDAVIANPNGSLSDRWFHAFTGVLDAYLGPAPTSFEYQGQTYTPASFAASLGLNASDYVEFSSYTHHPFYQTFALEVPDNWDNQQVLNVPVDDLMAIINSALDNGYTVAWAADVSEAGFSHSNGVAILPEGYQTMSKAEIQAAFSAPVKQAAVTQEDRQAAFNNYQTTDDHGMHITGRAKAQNGDTYYIVKNSWGESNGCGGYLFASEAYVRLKTMDIMVHRKSVPKAIMKRFE